MKKTSSVLILAMIAGLTACSNSDKDQSDLSHYELERTVIKSYNGLQGRNGKILYSDKEHILYYENYSDSDVSGACDLYLLDHEGKTTLSRHKDKILESEGNVYISEQYFFIDGEIGVMRFYSDFENDTIRLELGRIDPEIGEISQSREIDVKDDLLPSDRILSVDCIKGTPRIIIQREKSDLRIIGIDEEGNTGVTSYGKELDDYEIEQIINVYSLSDGSLIMNCRYRDRYDNDMIKIDTKSGDVKKTEVPFSYLISDLNYASSDPLFLKGATLCSLGADGVNEIFDVDKCDLDPYSVSGMIPAVCDDEPIFIATEGDELVTYSFKKSSSDPDKDKTEITLAHIGPITEELSDAVSEYNRSSDDHKIVFDDEYMCEAYCDSFGMYDYRVADTVDMGLSLSEITARLEDDIREGKGPDILIDAHLLSGLSDDVLSDPSEYLHADRSDILPCAFQDDDMVVYKIDSMGLLIDREEIVRVLGDDYSDISCGSLDLDEYLTLLDSYGGSYTYGLSYLGPSVFDMCLSLTDKDDISKLWDVFAVEGKGETMQSTRVFASLSDAVYCQSTEQIADDAFLTSLPSSDGDGFSLFASGSAAVTSKCSDKDAAGEFVGLLFENDVQEKLGVNSVSKKVFADSLDTVSECSDKFIKAAEEGRLVSYPDPSVAAKTDPVVISYINGETDRDAAFKMLESLY